VEEINLYDLLKYYARKWRVIVIAVMIGLGVGLVYNTYIQQPLYKSSATLLLIDPAGKVTPDDTLINNYVELFKSRRVLEPAIEEQNKDQSLNSTYDGIESSVQATNEKDTEVIKVSISTDDPRASQSFISAAIKSFKTQVDSLYGVDNVRIVDNASLPRQSSNVNQPLQLAIATTIGFVVAIIGLFFVYDFKLSRKNEIHDAETSEEPAHSRNDTRELTSETQTTAPAEPTPEPALSEAIATAVPEKDNSDEIPEQATEPAPESAQTLEELQEEIPDETPEPSAEQAPEPTPPNAPNSEPTEPSSEVATPQLIEQNSYEIDQKPAPEAAPSSSEDQIRKSRRQRLPVTRNIVKLLVGNKHTETKSSHTYEPPAQEIVSHEEKEIESQLDQAIADSAEPSSNAPTYDPYNMPPMPPRLDESDDTAQTSETKPDKPE